MVILNYKDHLKSDSVSILYDTGRYIYGNVVSSRKVLESHFESCVNQDKQNILKEIYETWGDVKPDVTGSEQEDADIQPSELQKQMAYLMLSQAELSLHMKSTEPNGGFLEAAPKMAKYEALPAHTFDLYRSISLYYQLGLYTESDLIVFMNADKISNDQIQDILRES